MTERILTPDHPRPDWGIPDWLDSGSYGDTKRWPEVRWRWEFTRRREDCRADFLAYKDEVEWVPEGLLRHLGVKRGSRRLRPDEPGFLAPVPGCLEKYGRSSLPNPAIGDQPFYILAGFGRRGPRLVLFPEDGIGDLKETTAVVKFDLAAPLGNQWKAIRPFLEARQKKAVGQIVNSGKKHPAKWLAYLRVLDARESGASYSEIAGSGVLEGLRKDADEKDAQEVLQQAQALCFKWPA
jgi:hypothetical protein